MLYLNIRSTVATLLGDVYIRIKVRRNGSYSKKREAKNIETVTSRSLKRPISTPSPLFASRCITKNRETPPPSET